MDHLKYCRVCLVTDVKMFSMSLSSIFDAYMQLMQITLSEKHLQYVCYECASLLHKYQEFRSKCHRAHNILTCIKMENSEVTKQTIQNINRKDNKLQSKLTMSSITIYNDQFLLPLDCMDTDEKFHLDNIKPEIISNKSDEITNKNGVLIAGGEDKHLILIPNQNATITSDDHNTDGDYVPKKKKKRKTELKSRKEVKIKHKKVKVEIETVIKEEPDVQEHSFDELDDEPLAKRLFNNIEEISVKKKTGPKFDASYFEDYATVVLLTPEDAKKEVLLRKESSNYKNCPYKCELCYRGFEAQATFENHMKKHSLEYGEYKCDFCHLRFPQQRFLCKHRLSCHKRKFYCKICPYTCFCTYQAKTHISLHKGKKYPCKECGEIFSMPNSLLMHKRVKHVTGCVCALCGSSFATPRGLYSHNMLLHRKEKNNQLGPECSECGVHFATEVAWKRHLVLSSKHEVTNGCEYCGDTFPDVEALKAHMRVHARKQMYRGDNIKLPAACPVGNCDKWLSDRVEYKTHVTAAHPQSEAAKRVDARERAQCVCEVCGKMFKKQCFLLYHQRKHTGERPYACRECGKAYAFPGALSAHRTTHARRPAHACHLCGKLFSFKSALNKHVKAHLGIRPHKCSICDKSFPNPCDVKLHMKYVHYKVPWPKRDRSKRGDGAEETNFAQYN